MKHKIKTLLVCIPVFALTGFLIHQNWAQCVAAFHAISPWAFVGLVCLQVPIVILTGYPLRAMLRIHGIQMKHREWVGLAFASYFVNYLLPYRPGLALRYWYIKRHYGLSLMDYISITTLYFLLLIGMNMVFLLSGWFFNPSTPDFPLKQEATLLGCVLVVFIVLFALMAIPRHQFAARIQYNLSCVLRQKHVLSQSLIGMFLIFYLSSLCIHVAFIDMGQPIPFTLSMFFCGAFYLSTLIHITPSNIGISESAIGGLSYLLLGDFGVGLGVALILRISHFIVSVLGGVPASLYLMGRWLPRPTPIDPATNEPIS